MLVIQDPTNPESTFLLESLLEAFRGAKLIAGAFAFASATGVELLTGDESFGEVATNHEVDIVVGLDAVTNSRAVDALIDVAKRFPRVKVRAFRKDPFPLFHPKLCWTKCDAEGRLVVGSGNLTEAGLLGNWEAYSTERLAGQSLADVERAWTGWATRNAANLLPISDPEVRELASRNNNNVMAAVGDLTTIAAARRPQSRDAETIAAQVTTGTAAVLVAEVPRSGNRWSQVNFQLHDYLTFFGARQNTDQLMMFRHVRNDGTLSDYERSRPPVEVVSQNFRFELGGAAGIPYPDAGRPIGVYIRVATRTFFYSILLPGDLGHNDMLDLLTREKGPPGHRMRSHQFQVDGLRKAWPNSPFWRMPDIAGGQ